MEPAVLVTRRAQTLPASAAPAAWVPVSVTAWLLVASGGFSPRLKAVPLVLTTTTVAPWADAARPVPARAVFSALARPPATAAASLPVCTV